MRRLICIYVVRIWQNDNRSFRTQIISYLSNFIPFWLFRTHFYFQFNILYPVWSLPVLVSYLHLLESESFRPLSRMPWVVSPPNRFVYFSVRPCVISPTFPFASQVDSPPYKFCFGLLFGVKFVLFEILGYKQWAMKSVSDVYIHF